MAVLVGKQAPDFTATAVYGNNEIKEGGIGQVGYPLVADVKHDICRAYDVELEAAGVALRGSFLIDKTGVVMHQVVSSAATSTKCCAWSTPCNSSKSTVKSVRPAGARASPA